jgi:hypothetical protein
MGEARQRGTYEQRKKESIKRNKKALIDMLGGIDEQSAAALRTGITPFLSRIGQDEWNARRALIVKSLQEIERGQKLEYAKPIRVQDDEIAWYLFLCEQALEDPLCLDVNQLARAAPFFVGIGERWQFAANVIGLDSKIDEVLHQYKSNPDGLIFEISVALAYAEHGWEVTLLDQCPPAKSPDMLIRKNGFECYVECKRMARKTGYAETERNEFLRVWDAGRHVLIKNRQWLWFKGVFHTEASKLSTQFLEEVFQNALPIGQGEQLIYDGPEATVHGRLIDRIAVQKHMAQWHVKANSPMVSKLLGGDWAPLNSSTTIAHALRTSQVVDCDMRALSTYIDEIIWASGFTRDFDNEVSIKKKAKDITKYLAQAIEQVHNDRPSIIHIAAETLEGKDVERLRTQKVFSTIPNFIVDKPVIAIQFHRFQGNQTIDNLWEFDETVDKFRANGLPLIDIPNNVVAPISTEMREGSHWEIYQ